MTFSYKRMVLKGVKYLVLFGLPMLVDQFLISFPQVAQLSVGALLVMGVNFIKVKSGFRIP